MRAFVASTAIGSHNDAKMTERPRSQGTRIFPKYAYQPRVAFLGGELVRDIGGERGFSCIIKARLGLAWLAPGKCVYEMRIRPIEMIPMLWFKQID